MKTKINILFISLLICYGILLGQDYTPRLQDQMNTLTGLSFETWKAKDDRITQFALPITFIYPVQDRMRIDVITSPAVSTLSSGESFSLGGLSDTRIRGHYLTENEKFLYTFGIVLPTGKNSLNAEEFNVANALTIHAFDFKVPNLGQGMDINLGVATAFEYGEYIVGAGLSYLKKNNYKPFNDFDFDYLPGDEYTFTAGAERNITLFGKDSRVTGDAVFTIYESDKGNDEKIFKSGSRLLLQTSAFIKFSNFDMLVFLREKIKGKNKTGIGDAFEKERKNRNGNEFEISGQALLPAQNGRQIIGLLDIKLYGNNQYNTGGATLFGLGGGYRMKINEQLFLDGSLRFYFGSITNASESTGITGIKLNGGIRYYF
ncbi:hypothetical protein JXQ31_15075 [candidate division KSB1 bacterium]|nr:hypothetical protein [candidate division KSB1 bacterium]